MDIELKIEFHEKVEDLLGKKLSDDTVFATYL